MPTDHRSSTIAGALSALAAGDPARARQLICEEYPHCFKAAVARSMTDHQRMSLFLRDGFIDRYTGIRLVNPGALRVLSLELPAEFPYHTNWKMSECHIGWYELCPTVDHVVAVARGGTDDESNWVTTSMTTNAAKSGFRLEEIPGAGVKPPGSLADWDGLSQWFVDFGTSRPRVLEDPYVGKWHAATVRALAQRPSQTPS